MDVQMTWNSLYVALGAVVAGVGTSVAWIVKHKKTWLPIVKAIGSSPKLQQLAQDVEIAIATRDSAIRNSEIRAVLCEGLLVMKDFAANLDTTEKWFLKHYLTEKLPPEIQPYVNPQTIENGLNTLVNLVSEAQSGDWAQALQRLRAKSN